MKDKSEKKAQLIKEIAEKSLRIDELEKSEAKHVKTEIALRESEELYRTLIETSPDIIMMYSLTGKILATNAQAAKVYGVSSVDELLREIKTVFDLLTEEGKAMAAANFRRTLNEGYSQKNEYLVRISNGTFIPMEINSSVVWAATGEPRAFISVIRDISERKQSEEAMQKSEKRYRLIAENTADLISILDMNLRFTYVSPATMRLLGFTVEESMQRSLDQVLTPESMQISFAVYKEEMRLEASGTADPNRTRILELEEYKKDGSTIWVEVSLSFLRDREGRPNEILIVTRDITERKRMENEIKNSMWFQRVLMDAVPSPIFYKNAQCVYIGSNTAYERYLGMTKDQFIGKTAHEIAPADLAATYDEADRKLLNNPGVQTYETSFVHADGTRRDVVFNKATYTDAEGKVAGLIGVIQDISERKRAEESLRESEEKFRVLADSTPTAVMLYQDDRWIYANLAAESICGYSEKELLDMNFWDLVHPEFKASIQKEGRKRQQGEDTTNRHEFKIIAKDGSEKWIDLSGASTTLGGKPAGILSILDITDRKRAEDEKRILEERLNRAEKMEALGQLAGGVAHDLNNVLGILSGYSELLLMEIPEGQKSRGHAEKILQSTQKGAAIIQDLLTLARRGVTVSDVINLNSVVSGFLETPVFEKIKDYHPRVTFKTECDNNLLNIKGSPVHLEKVLMNLISNAAEAISGMGEVTIRTESRYLDKAIGGYDKVKEGDYAVLTMSDTGIGISAEDREKIFEPFYTKKKMGKSGTGLGLAIVWGTVKDHNGYIDLQSKVGEGTTFTLYFPVTREEQTVPQQKEPVEQYMGNGESVLVIDDIAAQRDVAAGLLKKLGYGVHAVSGGEAAVEYLKGNKADILVLDMIMDPGIDGLETYQRVLEINPKQKAILVSGFSETDRVKKAQKLGAGAYVKKPYVMEKIGMAIRDELKTANIEITPHKKEGLVNKI